MNVLKLQDLFDNKETVALVLEEMIPTFDKINQYTEKMKEHQLDNPASLRSAMQILTGCHADVRVILGVAHSKLTNLEAKTYSQLKFDIENEGGKFTAQIDSATKKEATLQTSEYRDVYSVLLAYVEGSRQSINVIQSLLKDVRAEINDPTTGEH